MHVRRQVFWWYKGRYATLDESSFSISQKKCGYKQLQLPDSAEPYGVWTHEKKERLFRT